MISPLLFASPQGQEAALSAGAEGPIRRSGPVSSRHGTRGASAQGCGKGSVSAEKHWIHEASLCSVISSPDPLGIRNQIQKTESGGKQESREDFGADTETLLGQRDSRLPAPQQSEAPENVIPRLHRQSSLFKTVECG